MAVPSQRSQHPGAYPTGHRCGRGARAARGRGDGPVLEREGVSQRDLAKRVGRTQTYVQQRLALLGLVPELRAALDAGRLTVERARQLGVLKEMEQRAIANADPPYRATPVANAVANARRLAIPRGDPAAAARSIRSAYSGEQLAERFGCSPRTRPLGRRADATRGFLVGHPVR